MKKLSQILLSVILAIPMIFGGLSTLGVFSNNALNDTEMLSPTVEIPMGGGGQNSLTDPNFPDFPQPNDDKETEIAEYTFKTYEDYFTDLNITKETITEEDLTGTGSKTNPYIVHSTKGFLYLTNDSISQISLDSKYVELNCNLVLNDETFDENGNPSGGDGNVYSWEPICTGRNMYFNGDGNEIKGLYINKPETEYIGLFGARGSLRCIVLKEVKNFNMRNCFIIGKKNVSAFCNTGSVVMNCNVLSGTIKAESGVAGLINSVEMSIENCTNHANIVSSSSASGIVSNSAQSASISNCKNYGKIVGQGYVAGIVATQKCNIIEQCINYGDIEGVQYVAGISAQHDFEARYINCENYGDIQASYMICGGIVGCSESEAEFLFCKNYGNIGSKNASGQLIGRIYNRRSQNAIASFNVVDCSFSDYSLHPIMGMINSSKGPIDVFLNKCKVFSNKSGNLSCILFKNSTEKVNLKMKNMNVEISNQKQINLYDDVSAGVDFEMKNVFFDLSANSINGILNQITNNETTKCNIDSVLLLNNEDKFYYGTNFTGFYFSWKTGKIGLIALDGRGTFQGQIDEEWLNKKGYTKKEIV